MANNFFVYKNFKIGKSLIEDNTNEIIKKFMIKLKNAIVKYSFQLIVWSVPVLRGEGKIRI